jgi:colanic acid biosynthesis glycosyl transferase WcaI
MLHKVWVISELYYPEDTSTGYFITKIAEGLGVNFDVHVLSSQPTYSARGVRAPKFEKLNGVQIYRCSSTTLNKDNLLFKVINFFTISASIFLQALLRIRKSDLVLVVTNPPLLPFLIQVACLLRRARMVLLIHDVYPDVMVLAGFFSRNAVPAKIMEKITSKLYNNSEKIITLGRDMRALVTKKMATNPHTEKVIVITNWGDVDQIKPSNKQGNFLLEQLGLKNKFVVQYSGNIGRTHSLGTILETAKTLQNDRDIHFLIIGTGARQKWAQAEAIKNRLENVTFLPYIPRNELSISLNACDIAVISFITNMEGVSVPSRMYNIMAAGKPIIAAADLASELGMVVSEERIGWVVTPESPDELRKAIMEAYHNRESLTEMGFRARTCVERKYSFESIIQDYCKLFTNLSKGSLDIHENSSPASNRS